MRETWRGFAATASVQAVAGCPVLRSRRDEPNSAHGCAGAWSALALNAKNVVQLCCARFRCGSRQDARSRTRRSMPGPAHKLNVQRRQIPLVFEPGFAIGGALLAQQHVDRGAGFNGIFDRQLDQPAGVGVDR